MMVANDRGASRTGLVLIVGAAVVLVAVGLWLRRTPPAHQGGAPAAPAPDGTVVLSEVAAKEAGVMVEPARAVTRQPSLEAPGLVALDERRTARIGSPVEGKVLEVFVEIGDRVSTGKELAHLISPVVHDSWAAYRKAKAEERRARNDLALAVQNEARAKRLFNEKAISEQEVERAAANRVSAEEALNIILTEIRRAEEEMEHLGITNSEDPSGEAGEQIPVRSPLSGVVLEKLITEGTAVTPGTPLFVVSDLSSLWTLAEIDETALPRIRRGAPVTVRVAAYGDEWFPGTIGWVADVVNPKTRRITVRCHMPNVDGRLKPDMYATVRLGEGSPRPVVVVPSAAVQEVDGAPVVFVEVASGRYALRAVTVGPDDGGQTEVRTGLRAGERVVVAGAFLVKSELLKARTAED